ncbi:MAG: L-aspartate oxidase, partial [Actinomadura rubrobrunea]|nr:L-aspartate oxidase [Actinomadura rubrobrunea]
PEPAPAGRGLVHPRARGEIQRIMTAYAGVLRTADGLAAAARGLDRLAAEAARDGAGAPEPRVAAWEATNLLTVASAIVAAARLRRETRGSHWREDHPDRDDGAWRGHLVTRLADGGLTTSYEGKTTR